jgi:hypothetical protein
VLIGGLVVGQRTEIDAAPSAGMWQWGRPGAEHGHLCGGLTDEPDEAKAAIGHSFRAWCAWAGVAELPDTKPGPPVRRPKPDPNAFWTPPVHDLSQAPLYARAKYPPLKKTVRSGELICGVLERLQRGPKAGT